MKKRNVELTRAETDIICVGLNSIKGQYPKVVKLMHRLDEIFEKPVYAIHHPKRGWLVVGGTARYHSFKSWTKDVDRATHIKDFKEANDVLVVMQKADEDIAAGMTVREL